MASPAVYDEPAELSPEWREEVLTRCKEIDEGTVELEDADKVFARLMPPSKNEEGSVSSRRDGGDS